MSQSATGGSGTSGGGIPIGSLQSQLDNFTTITGFIFSWVVLLPTCVILSGKFLSSVFPMRGISKTTLRIPLWLFRIEAQNDEVVLGLTAFIVTLGIVALSGGEGFYRYAAGHFGIDPGQFHTLCFASAVITVAWSVTLWRLANLGSSRKKEREQTQNLMREIENKLPDRTEQQPKRTEDPVSNGKRTGRNNAEESTT